MRHERFDTPGPLRLDLSVPAGEIDVRTQEGAETTVDLEPLRGNDASREAIESARIQLRDRGDAHELVVDVPGSRGLGGIFSRGSEVRLVVVCPAGAELEAQGGSADIRAAGRYGSVEARAGSGDVSVGVRPGRRLWVDASSTSGETTSDFDVGDEPAPGEGEEDGPLVELRIATMSGDVHVARAAAADLQQ